MGRAKIAMEFITKEKTRNITYEKRKKGLIKKGKEFAILCNVPVCIIIYSYSEGKQPLEPEVYAFKGEEEAAGLGSDLKRTTATAREIIERYLTVPKEERHKKSLNMHDMFGEWKRKANQELYKLRHKNAMAKYPRISLNSMIDRFTPDQVMGMLGHLDQKIQCVNQRISMIKGSGMGIVPRTEQETPISTVMIPSETNGNYVEYYYHIGGVDNVGVFNQYPVFNYPMISRNNNNMQDSHEIGQFNSAAFPDRMGLMPPYRGGFTSNAVYYNYSMNLGLGPVYYDHRLGAYSAGEASSCAAASLPMSSMPCQLPVLSNLTEPKQCQMCLK